MDENFFGKVSRARVILACLAEFGMTWELNIHIRDLLRLDDDTFSSLAGRGVVRLRMGAESGSNRVLALLEKRITTDDIRMARDRCLRHGITPAMSFMIELPYETPDETDATWRLAEECGRAGAVVIGPQRYRPYPGSLEFDAMVRQGLAVPTSLEGWASSTLYNTA
jgi:radical SAM superfamily enzyme YgiQ (UPF0313 family)